MKGLNVDVFKPAGDPAYDCSNGGISAKHRSVILKLADGIEHKTSLPVVEVIERNVCGRKYLTAYPVDRGNRHAMFGGAFIFTSDSRFPSDYPIPLHDRFES